jgi:hypothetical protein
VIADIYVWRAANLLMKHHGFNAALVATQRADRLVGLRRFERQLAWKRIVGAITELQRPTPREGERVN